MIDLTYVHTKTSENLQILQFKVTIFQYIVTVTPGQCPPSRRLRCFQFLADRRGAVVVTHPGVIKRVHGHGLWGEAQLLAFIHRAGRVIHGVPGSRGKLRKKLREISHDIGTYISLRWVECSISINLENRYLEQQGLQVNPASFFSSFRLLYSPFVIFVLR